MKPLLLLALVLAPLLAFAQPATLKEVLAVEAEWQVAMPPRGADPTSFNRRSLFRSETAAAFVARLTSAASDADRKNASAIAKVNWAKLDTLVLTPAAGIDPAKAKALRDVLDRIAKAPTAATADQAELKRLLDSAR